MSQRGAVSASQSHTHHVVGALAGVPVGQPLWHDLVQHHLHVVPDVRIPTLVESQTGAGVQDCTENKQQNTA
jgi:hypothetical protein